MSTPHRQTRVRASLSLTLLLPVLLPYAWSHAQTTHFSFRANTEDSYAIVVQSASINAVPLENGDEIGVFTPAGLCVGASVVQQVENNVITAWLDDSFTEEIDGYQVGEAMSFRIWDQSSQIELDMPASFLQGDGTFGSGPYALVVLSRTFNFPPRTSFQPSYSFDEDTTFELNLNDNVIDENDDDMTLIWSLSQGVNLTSSIQSGNIARFEPAANWFGSEDFELIVSDPMGVSDTAVVTIEVLSVNDLPELSLPDTVTIEEDDSSHVLMLDNYVTDVENTAAEMTWQATPDPNIDVLYDVEQRTLRLLPGKDFFGSGRVALTVTDPDQGSTPGEFVVTVTPVQDQPTPAVLISPVGGVRVDTLEVTLVWRASVDVDGDGITYTAVYGTSRSLMTQVERKVTSDTSLIIPEGFLKPDNWYYWRIEANDGHTPVVFSKIDSFRTTSSTAVAEIGKTPTAFSLAQNYPNPLALSKGNGLGPAGLTVIRFSVPKPAQVSLTVYNAIGQKVRRLLQSEMAAGFHEVVWNGTNGAGELVSTGIYWLRLESPEFTATRRMMVIR